MADFEKIARERMDPSAYDYYAGGANDERTVADNLRAFERWVIRPRVLAGVREVDTSTTLLGTPMTLPVALALTGWSLWFGEAGLLWYLVGYLAMATTFVRLYEEPTLHRLFGSQYDQYRAHVRAWIPGRPWSGS